MARAALNWTVRDLAKATDLRRNTITNIEVGRYAGNRDSIALIESVFRKAGAEFLPQNGVRFHEPPDTCHEEFCSGLPSGPGWRTLAPNGSQELSLRL